MNEEQDKTLGRLIHNSKRKAMGRIAQKEVKSSLLIIALFKTFHIKSRANPLAQEGRIRGRIQEIIDANIVAPSGHFHFKDFCDSGFVNDLKKEFDLALKTP